MSQRWLTSIDKPEEMQAVPEEHGSLENDEPPENDDSDSEQRRKVKLSARMMLASVFFLHFTC